MNYFTLNNINDLFKLFAQNHYQLKRYGNGEIYDIETMISDSQEFPVMWSNLIDIQYPAENVKTFNFNVLFFDILKNDKSNELEVWSDQIQIAEDFVRFLNHNATNYYEILGTPVINTFTERFSDFVGGCNINIVIQVDSNLQNDCGLPMDNFTFDIPSFIASGGTSGGGTNFNCSDLEGCDLFTSLSAQTQENTANIIILSGNQSTFVTTSVFNSYSASTDTQISNLSNSLSAYTLNSIFNSYSASTDTQINNLSNSLSAYTLNSTFNTYTGNTSNELTYLQSEIDAISAATANAGIITGITDNLHIDLSISNKILEASLKKDFNSGLISGATLSISSNPAKIDITAGYGIITDWWTLAGIPISYEVNIPAQTGVTLTYLATSTLTYIGVDKTGTLVQFNTEPTNSQRRDIILLGQIGHTNNVSIGAINSFVTSYEGVDAKLRDIVSELHLINTGNQLSANGANLRINKSNGYLFGLGINYRNDIKNPNKVNTPAQTPISFRYRTQSGGTSSLVTDIDPTKYDNAGIVTSFVGGNKATNQRIYLFPNGNIVIQYGQTVYNSLTEAISNAQYETFVEYTNPAQAAILIGILSVSNGATALNNSSNAKFLPVSKFGENLGGAAGTAVTTLQQAYNNSVTPEITTSSSLGALSIKNGAGIDTNNIFEGLSSGGTITSYIQGNGNASFGSLSATTIYSGTTNLTNIFSQTGHTHSQYANLSGATFTGTVYSPTLSGGTIYSGGTDLNTIINNLITSQLNNANTAAKLYLFYNY